MTYLSQLLNKKIYYQDKPFGKVVDFGLTDEKQTPPVAVILIKKNGKKMLVPAETVSLDGNRFLLREETTDALPQNIHVLFLSEDLLDKQVIDVSGRRVVRVNDILLNINEKISVVGIDVGMSGIFRRLGLQFIQMPTVTIPWSYIEAFDYQTGNVRIKLTQSKLNTLQPAEVADILEDVGTKERLGLVEALDVKRVASAIEEASPETQTAILEQLPTPLLKTIVDRMHLSELADVIDTLNTTTGKQVLSTLGVERAKKVLRLSLYADDVAGGLMETEFIQFPVTTTIGEAVSYLREKSIRPEALVITNDDHKIAGVVATKQLITSSEDILLKDMIHRKFYVFEETDFAEIVRYFTNYNLRILPVVDKEKKVVGIIKIDTILARIQEEEEREDAI